MFPPPAVILIINGGRFVGGAGRRLSSSYLHFGVRRLVAAHQQVVMTQTQSARVRRFVGWAVLVTLACSAAGPTIAAESVDFARDIRPLLASKCVKCHGRNDPQGGLNLTDGDAARRRLESGLTAVTPGDPQASELLRRVTSADPETRMPPTGEPLTGPQIELLQRWIAAGAEWPVHWSLRRLERPAVPATSVGALRNPIDAFIGARLQAQGFASSPEADRRVLARRLWFDLLGLPPTPEELSAFVADPAPDAYERLVERLLASPQFGERWARHWIDLVHFAETHGHDQDRPRPNAWPYRDYLIDSFNSDKPYARFVQEQIAGDVLFPDDPQGVVGTAMLAAGPWDESSLMSIMDNTVDKQIAQYLDRDDMVTTALSTFTSLTVHCARCHDHKFDPITQADYYALQAVFAGVDKAERPFDPDPAVGRRRRELLGAIARLETLRGQVAPDLLADDVQAKVAVWEARVRSQAQTWAVLTPLTATSANGATLTIQEDGSVLSHGPKPETDTYTITARIDLPEITGLRLEVLNDDSLPHRGPGRQDNGNLHLSELHVFVAPASDPEARREVALRVARADYDQPGWTIAHAIDRQPKTAWGIYPEVGKPHRGVFEFAEAVRTNGPSVLTVALEQLHGGGHLIGKPRLAVSTAPLPLPLDSAALPAEISQLLIVPAAERSEAQRAALGRFVLEGEARDALVRLPAPQLVYAAAADFKPDGNFRPAKTPRPIFMLHRGDIRQPRDAAQPGALQCVPDLPGRFSGLPPDAEGARRAALAEWLTRPENGLTWRSIANRLWQHHFGRGLVDTPNDFGALGSPPSHPELLDWLAVEVRDSGGSLKHVHRLIVNSAAYRQTSDHRAACAAVDADNRLLWRMNRRRLDAETIRDALLRLSDRLDDSMGGPSVKQFIQTPGIHVTPNVDYLAFDPDRPESSRRTIYRFLFRTLPDPFLEALDCPDSSQLAPVRNESLTALQALAMLNDQFLIRQTEHLAARLESDAAEESARVRTLVQRAFGRDLRDGEANVLLDYAHRHGWPNLCRVIVNANEFLFVE